MMRIIWAFTVLSFLAAPVFAAKPKTKSKKSGTAYCDRTLKKQDDGDLKLSDLAKIEETVDKKVAAFIKDNLRLPTVKEAAIYSELSEEDTARVYDPSEVDFNALQLAGSRQLETARNKFVNAYAKLVRETQRLPSLQEITALLGAPLEGVRPLFGPGRLFKDMAELKVRTMAKRATAFINAIDTDIFTSERSAALIEAVKSRKRLILTTAVAGAPVNRVFFDALRTYAEEMDAEIIVYPANMMTTGLDPILLETPGVHVLVDSVELSPWLNLNNIKILPRSIWPLEGLDRIGKRGQSQVVGSPKLHSKIVPTLDNQISPHVLATTGALTDPIYSKFYRPRRAETIAMNDHVMGALILERNNGGSDTLGVATVGAYHMRNVEFIPEKGGFMDLGRFYTASSVKRVRPEALVLGDIHVGYTDQSLLESLKQVFSFRPKTVILHDLLNGHSVSHHDRFRFITMAQKAKEGTLDLEKEIRDVVTFLNALLAVDSSLQVVIVPSNHNFWLHRWLDEGEFMRDHKNRSVGLDLAKVYKDGNDPVEYALMHYGLEAAKVKRISFMKAGGKFKVGPANRLVELGQHGHAGANGAKADLRAMQRGSDRVVFGHTHTNQRLNGSVNVGTSTPLVLSYSREGMSNWSQSLAQIGESGEIQVLRLQDREWFTPAEQQPLEDDAFFMPGYPRLH